ncbi:MAG: NAD(P)-dependent alcohol dehydrogenase [Nitriliruptoraceae bacterium]|nr:NAD(P)-dependent alcohol dehydrogenase [Nitriliruptoraceae bacterium]
MRTIRHHRYGPPLDVLGPEDADLPEPGEGQVLVRVVAAGLNALDKHLVTGRPAMVRLAGAGLRRPTRGIPGRDLAGVVTRVGAGVTGLAVGDAVVGTAPGSLAEVVAVSATRLVPKPTTLSFEQAAAIPIAGITAHEALHRVAGVQPGHRVLITGGSGGVGTFAVQIAAAAGAEVTASCRTRNVELVRSLGAAHVVDYTRADPLTAGGPYQAIIELAGRPPTRDCRRALVPGGIHVLSGGTGGPLLGPLPRGVRAVVGAVGRPTRATIFLATERASTLTAVLDLVVAGAVTPVIDRVVPLAEAPQALAYVCQGHTRGKVVVRVAAAG